jgi:predicted MFS family arabinose efflux permease
VLVQHASWRWVFYVNLPLGALALAGLRLALPAPDVPRPTTALDVGGAVLLAGGTAAVTLACIWGGDRFAWTSPAIVALLACAVLLGLALVVRERTAADPIVPLAMLKTRAVAVSSAALFLATATLFSVTVFVPLYLQKTTGATPTQAGLLLVPAMLGITISTNVVGRAISATGRYKRYPVVGLGLMAIALGALALVAAHPSRTGVGFALALFGLGFGMVGQVLITAVQNSVDRRELGIAMATTSFFRGLGGAIGAAVFGAVFAAQSSAGASVSALSATGGTTRTDVIDGVQAVFIAAAPIALLALAIVLALREVPLATGGPSLPLDRARRLAGDVQHDPADRADLARHA